MCLLGGGAPVNEQQLQPVLQSMQQGGQKMRQAGRQAGGKVGHYTAFRYEWVDGRGRWASLEIYRAPAMNSFRPWKLNRGGCERLDVILAKSVEKNKTKNTCTNKLRLLHKPRDVSTHDQNKEKKKKVILKESFCVRWQVFVSSLNPSSVFARSREKVLKCLSVTHGTKQWSLLEFFSP